MSKKYIQQRDKLIPHAERIANVELEKATQEMREADLAAYKKNPGLWRSDIWNRAFHRSMNQMAFEKGLMVL